MSQLRNKYLRQIFPAVPDSNSHPITVDVYSVIAAFEVVCPATQHAIKKLLCSGIRGHKNREQDLLEAIQSIERAIIIEKGREDVTE